MTAGSDTELLGRTDEVLRRYDGQGWHRTGTEVDDRSADWLAAEVRERGALPELHEFALLRVDVRTAGVLIDGRRIDGLPLFDAGFTSEGGVVGRLGPLGSDAEIGWAEAAPGAQRNGELGEARRTSRHRVIVLATRGGRPGIAALNAVDFLHPFGPPVLQVAGEERDWLQSRGAGCAASVAVCAERTPARARNVVVRVAGREPGLSPVGVVTPRSGWWACTAERGGGIACWLEILARLCTRRPRRDVLLVATSGHELGFMGFDAFLDDRTGLAPAARAWLHLGANIGAADPGRGTVRASDEELLRSASAALDRRAAGPYVAEQPGGVLAGEARNIHVRGGRFLSLVGANSYFHLEADRYPWSVNADAVARYAGACADLVVSLTESD